MIKYLRIGLPSKRIYGLDILRAFAILFVVIAHGKSILPTKFHILHKYIALDGVSIFFVLSGFLIGGILIKILENNVANKNLLINFWIRRWFRTLPNYFLVLIVLIFFSFLYSENFTIWSVKEYFYFSQNLWTPHPKFFPEAWSLSIEEWFYLLIPIILFIFIGALKIRTKHAVIITAISIIILVTVFRYYRFSTTELENIKSFDKLFRLQVITRLDSLMYGVIGAYIAYYYKSVWLKQKVILLLFGLILFIGVKTASIHGILPVRGLLNCVFSFSIISIATLLLLPFLSDLKNGKGFMYRSLTYISLISYSMYLINFSLVKRIIINKIPWEGFIKNDVLAITFEYLAFWSLTIGISALLYKYFEIPMMKLRDHQKIKKLLLISKSENKTNHKSI